MDVNLKKPAMLGRYYLFDKEHRNGFYLMVQTKVEVA